MNIQDAATLAAVITQYETQAPDSEAIELIERRTKKGGGESIVALTTDVLDVVVVPVAPRSLRRFNVFGRGTAGF